MFQVLSPNISVAEASHRAHPKSKGAWRYTTPKVGRQVSKYLPSKNPNLTKGFTEEVSYDLGLEGGVGFFQVKMGQSTAVKGMKCVHGGGWGVAVKVVVVDWS